jgi:hypothetical protein
VARGERAWPKSCSAGSAKGLRCLHRSTQVAALQTGDVALRFVDVSPQCCGMERGAVPLQPVHLANHLVPQIAQCPDQYLGLDCIAFTHRGIVAHADELGAMNRPATGERTAGR